MARIVKINFFQKSFDSKFRNFLFNWNQGNYLKYLKNRVQWYLYPNLQKVAPFPLHVDIETAATCNMRCPMCFNRSVDEEKFINYGKMDFELFKKIIDECAANNVFSVRLSWRGEVFTNAKFIDFVHYAKVVKKIPQVSFLTNGLKLKEKNAQKLIEYGVDYISVSIDGMGDMYDKIRFPSKFDNIYKILQDFMELRRKTGKKKPQVRITTLWPAVAKHPKEYYDKMSKVSDMIVFNPLKDYSITVQDRQGFDICQFLWERLFIAHDGKVQPCSSGLNDFYIGDLNLDSIKSIWHGKKLNEIRQMHKDGERLKLSQCSVCSYGVDFEKRWKDRDWTTWNPEELIPKKEPNTK